MPAPFSILVLDLHNTLYDEVGEYGLAIDEAVTLWLEETARRRLPVTRETLYGELARAHYVLGSDWDAQVWRSLPSLKLPGFSDSEFDKILVAAEMCRKKKSRELTLNGTYEGVQETLLALKKRGVRIYVITEATADVGMNAIGWLKLGGIVDGVYSYPSHCIPHVIPGTFHKAFPSQNGEHIKKPNPLLIAALALDEAIRRGEIQQRTKLSDVFEVSKEKMFLIPELPEELPIQNDIAARLIIKDTPYAQVLNKLLGTMLFVGDSKFKDGLLARNADIAFGYAAYGKKIKRGYEENHQKSLDIMYAVTGWDKDVIKLTQEASHSEMVNSLQPTYTFENTLSEALGLFVGDER